jgi:hypothetical protein
MKSVITVVILLFAALPVYADGPKSCEDLKSEIAKKLDANNATGYTLEIVDKDKDADGKVVGSCGGGTKKIVYSKGSGTVKAPAVAPAAAPAKKP